MSRFLSKNCDNPHEEARRRREVRRYFDKADVNKDGKLSKEEWHSVLNGSGVPTSNSQERESRTGSDYTLLSPCLNHQQVIAQIQYHRNKPRDCLMKISADIEIYYNFKSTLLCPNHSFQKEEVEEFFEYMDRDFDGRLSFEEFMGEECTIEKLFKNMDKNGDGYVSKQEFLTICKNLTTEQVEVAFAQFDSSGDDRLDYREFCEMCNKKNI